MTIQPAPSKKKTSVWLVALVVLLVIGLCAGVGAALFSGGDGDSPVATPQTTKVVEQPAAIATSAKPAPKPAPTIEDGVWTVGVDFPAGKYRVTAAAGGDCYWSITKSGTNGSDIINNGLGGGRPTVTLKKGQDFETARCGTWAKIG